MGVGKDVGAGVVVGTPVGVLAVSIGVDAVGVFNDNTAVDCLGIGGDGVADEVVWEQATENVIIPGTNSSVRRSNWRRVIRIGLDSISSTNLDQLGIAH